MNLLVMIPNFSRNASDVEMLRRCLQSVRRHEPEVAVLVWDDRSPVTSSLQTRIAEICHNNRASLVFSQKAESYSAVVNQMIGWAQARGHAHFCTMNSDIECVTPFCETARAVWDGGLADVFGGTLLYPTGRVQSAGFSILPNGVPNEYDKYAHYLTDVKSKQAKYVPGVTGAMQFFHAGCGLYPKSEGYLYGYEDVHFCLAQWTHGRRVLYVPAIEAVHCESITRGKFPGQRDIDSVDVWHRHRGQFDLPAIEAECHRRTQELTTR